MGDIQFVEGLRAFRPSDKAPAHIKAKLTFNRAEFSRWIAAARVDDDGNVRAEICESKAGKYYARLDDYKPQGKRPDAPPPTQPADDPNHPRERADGEQLPF